MIGNPEWFNRRKYTGWGLTPNSWQGWAYIGFVALPLIFVNQFPINDQFKTGFLLIWSLFFVVDFIDIMRQVKRDERDKIHEAIAERNAMWFMIAALAIGLAFQSAKSMISGKSEVDPIILIAMIGAVVVKAVTHWWLRDK